MKLRKKIQAQNPNLTDSVKNNIQSLATFYEREEAKISRVHTAIETVCAFFGRPAYFVSMLIFVALWILANTFPQISGWPQFDEPPYFWLQGIVSLNGLVLTIALLIRQNRLAQLVDQRAHLDLQVNLLTEQKTTKIIQLIEELRRDSPNIHDRHDHQVDEMQTLTDPHAVLQAIKGKQEE